MLLRIYKKCPLLPMQWHLLQSKKTVKAQDWIWWMEKLKYYSLWVKTVFKRLKYNSRPNVGKNTPKMKTLYSVPFELSFSCSGIAPAIFSVGWLVLFLHGLPFSLKNKPKSMKNAIVARKPNICNTEETFWISSWTMQNYVFSMKT